MIKRKVVASQLTVYLDVQLDFVNPILGEIAKVASTSASRQTDIPLTYRTSGITLSPNTLTSKFTPTIFSIERRLDTPDSQNKYFSTAPLHTSEHLDVLRKFEKALQK
jgi:adenylosuccinate lyase